MKEEQHQEDRARTAESLIGRFEEARIEPTNIFSELYATSAIESDKEYVRKRQAQFLAGEGMEGQLGSVGEAVVLHSIGERKCLGSGVGARSASHYDDIYNGVDILLWAANFQDPAISTIDVTMHQKDVKGAAREACFAGEENNRPVGLEQKLRNIKKKIDDISLINPNIAREWNAWLKGGGFRERYSDKNKDYFALAKKAMLLKYYITPESGAEPNKPQYVLGGPQVVLSLDISFVNKVLSDGVHQERHLDAVDTILQIEMGYGVAVLQRYFSKIESASRDRNLIFDNHYAATKAWADMFNDPEQREIFERAVARTRTDRDIAAQVSYYMKTWGDIFRL